MFFEDLFSIAQLVKTMLDKLVRQSRNTTQIKTMQLKIGRPSDRVSVGISIFSFVFVDPFSFWSLESVSLLVLQYTPFEPFVWLLFEPPGRRRTPGASLGRLRGGCPQRPHRRTRGGAHRERHRPETQR